MTKCCKNHCWRELGEILNAGVRRCEVMLQDANRSPDKKERERALEIDEINRLLSAAIVRMQKVQN